MDLERVSRVLLLHRKDRVCEISQLASLFCEVLRVGSFQDCAATRLLLFQTVNNCLELALELYECGNIGKFFVLDLRAGQFELGLLLLLFLFSPLEVLERHPEVIITFVKRHVD